MSYNNKPNILVDGLVLPNKQLLNLEITDATKKLSISGFRVFLRDSYHRKAKKTRCGILNLDSSSGDGIH